MTTPPIPASDLPDWVRNAQAPAPSPAAQCHVVDQTPPLSGVLDPIAALRTMPPQTARADRTTLALSHALVTRLWRGANDLSPLARLWARHAQPAQRAQLLTGGGLSLEGPWWADAQFAEEAATALDALAAAGVPLWSLSATLDQIRRVLVDGVSLTWPTGTWLRLWRQIYLPMVSGPLGARARVLALAGLNDRVALGYWSPTASDLAPLLESPDAEIRVWAQCALAGVPPTPSTLDATPIAPDPTRPAPT